MGITLKALLPEFDFGGAVAAIFSRRENSAMPDEDISSQIYSNNFERQNNNVGEIQVQEFNIKVASYDFQYLNRESQLR